MSGYSVVRVDAKANTFCCVGVSGSRIRALLVTCRSRGFGLYFDEDTLIRTLPGVRWMYFDEDTLICTLSGARWMYFVEDTLICTLSELHKFVF